jgi:hypothetical protein
LKSWGLKPGLCCWVTSPSLITYVYGPQILIHLSFLHIPLPCKQERECVPSSPTVILPFRWPLALTGLQLGLVPSRHSETERLREGKCCWLTQLYRTDTDWLDSEFSFHGLQDTNNWGLSQGTANPCKGEETAVRMPANIESPGAQRHLGVAKPPMGQTLSVNSQFLFFKPSIQELYGG